MTENIPKYFSLLPARYRIIINDNFEEDWELRNKINRRYTMEAETSDDSERNIMSSTEKEGLLPSHSVSQPQCPKNTTFFVYLLTCFAAIGGFLFGYDTGVVSGAMILLRDEFQLSTLWQELVVSTTIGTAIIGSIVGGMLNDILGRKPNLLCASAVFTLGASVMAISKDKVVLLIGRMIVGLGVGKIF